MKKILTMLLVASLMLSLLVGCGDDQGSNTPDTQTGNPDYTYTDRELPEARYMTPAADFAGGNGTEADPWQISTAAELALLHERLVSDAQNVKNDYTSAYYVLTADIALNDVTDFDNWEEAAPEYAWMPIGFDVAVFDGVFDGQGHNISGLYINANAKDHGCNYGLFDTVNGTVKNVNVEKSYFSVSGKPCALGSVAGLLMDEAHIENCTSSAVFSGYDATLGGIVGQTYGGVDTGIVDAEEDREIKYPTISGCTFTGVITQVKDGAAVYMGGIIGSCDGNVENCVNAGDIHFAAGNVDAVGGIAGRMSEGTMVACRNQGTLDCTIIDEENLAIAGGIVGKLFVSATGSEKYMSRGAELRECVNTGMVTAQMYAGGIAGQVSNDHNDYCITISDCTNSGMVAARDYTGGVVGYLDCLGDTQEGESILLENCQNQADLSGNIVGGIVARMMTQNGNLTIGNCTNTGNLTAEGQHCAGIIAYWVMNSQPANSNITIDGCTNDGSLNSNLNAGGIISYMDMPICLELGGNLSITLASCVNTGSVTTNTVNGYIGGILGNWGMANIPTTITGCTNAGNLYITAAADGMTEEDAEKMTVSRIAGGIIGRVGSGLLLTTDSDTVKEENIQATNAVLQILDCENAGMLDVVNVDAEFYMNWFGGIVGNTCGEDEFSLFAENCTYSGFDRGLGNPDVTDIGTKN